MNKNLIFAIEDIEIIEEETSLENDNRYFVSAKIQAFSSDINRHDMFCSEETLLRTAASIYYKPILYVVDKKTEDFGSHASPETARPAGVILHDSAEFERLPDGRLALMVGVKIWKRYASQAIDIFKRDGGHKKVSVELDLLDYEMQPDGLMEMKDFRYVGVVILGDAITEASPGAHIKIASFAEEDRAFREALLLEFSTKYDSIDFTIPDEIKKNCQMGLNLFEERGGGNPRILSHARFMIKNNKMTPSRAFLILKDFNSNNFEDNETGSSSEGHVIYLLLGGKEGFDWIVGICQSMEDADDQSLSYFENLVFFPYQRIEDINPALKGISPPISLTQANQIASVADKLIEEGKEDSESWGIAISRFKKSHVAKDEIWVKNSKEEGEKGEDYSEVKTMEENEILENERELENAGTIVEPAQEQEVEQEESGEQEEVFSSEEENSEKVDDVQEDEPEDDTSEEEEPETEDMDFDKDLLISLLSEGEIKVALSEEFEKGEGAVSLFKINSLMLKALVEMSSQVEAFSKENDELKQYKKTIEEKEFALVVNSTLSNLSSEVEIPEGILEEMRVSSESHTLETIDGWKNEVRAKALDFAIKGKTEKEGIRSIAFPWTNVDNSKKDSIWEKINK